MVRNVVAEERFPPVGGAWWPLSVRSDPIGIPPTASTTIAITSVAATVNSSANLSRRRRPFRRASLINSSAFSGISNATSCRIGEIVIESSLMK